MKTIPRTNQQNGIMHWDILRDSLFSRHRHMLWIFLSKWILHLMKPRGAGRGLAPGDGAAVEADHTWTSVDSFSWAWWPGWVLIVSNTVLNAGEISSAWIVHAHQHCRAISLSASVLLLSVFVMLSGLDNPWGASLFLNLLKGRLSAPRSCKTHACVILNFSGGHCGKQGLLVGCISCFSCGCPRKFEQKAT